MIKSYPLKSTNKLRVPLSIIINSYWNCNLLVSDGMFSCQSWDIAVDMLNLCRPIWITILTPASNDKVANHLVEIMLLWLNSCTTEANFCQICEHALHYFNFLVQVYIGGALHQSYVLSKNAFLLEGRCKNNFTILSRESHVTIGKRDRLSSRYIIIHTLKSLANQTTSCGTDTTIQPITVVQVYSFSDLINQYKTSVQSIAEILQFLKWKYHVEVIFTTTEISGSLLHEIAAAEMTIVDQVPPEQLLFLAMKTNVRIFDSEYELMQPESNTLFAENTPSSFFGELNYLQNVHLRPKTYDPVVCIVGLQMLTDHTGKMADLSTTNASVFDLPQLVIKAESEAIGRLYLNMIRRCLTAAVATKAHCKSSPNGDLSRMLVPGGGAAEMAWSIVWELVAGVLEQHMSDTRLPCAAVESSVAQPSLESVAGTLSKSILDQVHIRFPDGMAMQQGTLLDLISLCRILARAYGEVPMTLLRNSRSLTDDAASATRSSTELIREWVVWRDLCLKGHGRVGLVMQEVNRTGRLAYTRPAYADSFSAGVASSGVAFLSGFTALLDTVLAYVRVGGDSGIISIHRKTRQTKLERSVSLHSDDSDEDSSSYDD